MKLIDLKITELTYNDKLSLMKSTSETGFSYVAWWIGACIRFRNVGWDQHLQ